jgi:hypothetical protein
MSLVEFLRTIHISPYGQTHWVDSTPRSMRHTSPSGFWRINQGFQDFRKILPGRSRNSHGGVT